MFLTFCLRGYFTPKNKKRGSLKQGWCQGRWHFNNWASLDYFMEKDSNFSIKDDPVSNAIYGESGIKRGIKVCLDNKCFGSALILLYSAIDILANLGMPDKQREVTPKDFIFWVNKYLTFDAKEKVSGEEWYSARCAVIHTYGVRSEKTKRAKARMLGYVVGMTPPIKYDSLISKELVMVDVRALAEAFFVGLDRFLIDLFSNSKKRLLIESRLNELLCLFPRSSKPSDSWG